MTRKQPTRGTTPPVVPDLDRRVADLIANLPAITPAEHLRQAIEPNGAILHTLSDDPVSPQMRVAVALERIAVALEVANRSTWEAWAGAEARKAANPRHETDEAGNRCTLRPPVTHDEYKTHESRPTSRRVTLPSSEVTISLSNGLDGIEFRVRYQDGRLEVETLRLVSDAPFLPYGVTINAVGPEVKLP